MLVQGRGGPLASFLSSPVFLPLSRISYCLYLVHLTVMMWVNSQASYSVTFTLPLAMSYYISNMVFSMAVALVMVVLFEAPILHLEKLALRGMKEKLNNLKNE